MVSSPARRVLALELRCADRSATTEPAPASRTIMSSTSDSWTSERSQRSENRGSRVVRLMKTIPWVAKASAAARRASRSAASGVLCMARSCQ